MIRSRVGWFKYRPSHPAEAGEHWLLEGSTGHQERSEMYVQVAHYKLGTGTTEDLRPRVEEGPVKVMRDVPGFVDYYAFDAGDGWVASVSVFGDRAGVEEAERRLAEWVEQTVSELDISPGQISEGEVFASPRLVV
jgi:hypothetical protein